MAKRLNIMQAEFRKDAIRESPSDGAIIVPVRMAQVGVRSYFYENSDTWEIEEVREAFLPSELFREETLESLKGLLITHYHPWSMLNKDNWDYYSKGVSIGEPTVEDNQYITMDVKIFDETLQAYVLSGIHDGCSVGYEQIFVPEPGNINGENYDGYNSQIIFNHLAFCAREDARGGEDLGVKTDMKHVPNLSKVSIDSRFNIKMDTIKKAQKIRRDSNNQGGSQMAKVKIGGKEFEVDSAVASRIDTLEVFEASANSNSEALKTLRADVAERDQKLKDLQAKCDTAAGERDAYKADLDKANEQVNGMKAKMDTMLSAEDVEKKVELAGKVSKITGKDEDFKMDSKDLHLAALKAGYPEESFEGRTDSYIEARFDVLYEKFNKEGFPTNVVLEEGAGREDTVNKDSFVDKQGRAANHYSMQK